MNIAVIGTGYVGLVTGTGLAESGNNVICVDVDEKKLQKLKNGIVPIYEPGLEPMFKRNLKEGRLHFTNNLAEAVEKSEIIFLALPTPPKEDGSADLKYVLGVAKDIAQLMKEYKIIVTKSTVPVGTGEKIKEIISSITDVPFDVVSNPEFLREGSAVQDFMKPDRIVVGVESEKAKEIMETLYKPFVRSGNPIVFMDIKSAELTKYAANSFLATKISFMNEIARLAERVGANVDYVRIGIGLDERIGKRFLFAGVGYGGSCFPKDVSALYKTAKQYGYEFEILKAVMKVNEEQRNYFFSKILDYYNGNLKGKKFAVWGLAFKPNTDDIREAPSIKIINLLLDHGANVRAYDPEAMTTTKEWYPNLPIEYAENPYDALKDADALIIITEWNEFRTPDFNKIKQLLKEPVIFDGRNVYDVNKMAQRGFDYISIGRPAVLRQKV